ncbi:hypothetical protein JCM3775_004853 [Rhodotorula graminis]
MSSSSPAPPPTVVILAQHRAPPPREWRWASPAFDFDLDALPPLPAIRSAAIADRARTTKAHLAAVQPLAGKHRNEVLSNRPLEWLGDAVLNTAISEELYARFPGTTPGLLTVLRSDFIANRSLSHLSRAYGLDGRALDASPPLVAVEGISHLHSQKPVADLFEAHIGGLSSEGRKRDVARWVYQMITSQSRPVEARVAELRMNEAAAREGQPRHKRQLAESADERRVKRQTCVRPPLLPVCPVLVLSDDDDDDDAPLGRFDPPSETVGCGRRAEKHKACVAALNDCLELCGTSAGVRAALATLGGTVR